MRIGIEITNQLTASQQRDRNALLQRRLRDPGVEIAIEKEYPLLLDPQDTRFSYCALAGGSVVAHAHLWPRQVISASNKSVASVGLIGNVVTHEDWENKGVMREMLQLLEDEAKKQKLAGLLLWSDLSQFYQKLGFEALGQEWRLKFLPKPSSKHGQLPKLMPANMLDKALAQQLMALRPTLTYTLARSAEDMVALLHIPDTFTFVTQDKNGNFTGFYVIGKGVDMVLVAHEWGKSDVSTLPDELGALAEHFAVPHITLLLPGPLAEKHQSLISAAAEAKMHHMTLAKLFPDEQKTLRHVLAESFIWGLDSI